MSIMPERRAGRGLFARSPGEALPVRVRQGAEKMLALILPSGALAAIGALTLPLTALSFAVSVIGACWAFWFKRRLRDAGVRIGTEKARYEAMAAFHDALLDNGMQGIVVDPGPDRKAISRQR